MLYRLLVFTSLFITLSFISNAQSDKELDAFTVQVEGLGCPFCAYGLEKKFKELKGLKKPVIDMETGKFTFLFPAKEALSITRVEKQVDAAGYTAVHVRVERANGAVETSEAATTATKTTGKKETATLAVAGNCGMCKARIEKAAKATKGVSSASWSSERQQLEVAYNPQVVDLTTISKNIAQKGHDTELVKASKKNYEQLHACCLYKRMK